MPVTAVLRRLKQDDHHEFEGNLDYLLSSKSAWIHSEALIQKQKKKKKN